jgi:hypothetical protein
MWRVAVLLWGLACSGGWSVAAADARPARPQAASDPAMQVHLVRSAEPGCEPSCPEWIAAQGRIEAGSVARFRRVLSQLGNRKLPVLIDSNGGRVSEAFEIGRLARAKGLDVVVSRTVLTQCAPADTDCRRRAGAGKMRLGLPKADESKCASSCAFILAAGTRRMVGPTAFVGVHQIRSFYVYARVLRTYRVTATSKQLVSERKVTEKVVETHTPERTYDQIRSYFAEMGVGEAIMPLILSTPGDSLHWLTREELQSTALATDSIDGEQLLTRVATPLPALQAPAQAATAVSDAPGTVGGAAARAPGEAPAPVSSFAPD